MSTRKIAIVCDWYPPRMGGLELHLGDLARELRRHGHDAQVICSTPGPANLGDGVPVHRLPVPLMPGMRTIRDHRARQLLERQLLDGSYDVVHTHNAYSPLAHLANYLASVNGLPSVFTEHSVLAGAFATFLRSLNRVMPWGRWPTLLSAVSRYVADELSAVSGRPGVHVLHNGIHPAEWAVDRAHAAAGPGDPPLLVSYMRFTRRKRAIDIVRALPWIDSLVPPTCRPRVLIAGDGSQRAAVRAEAEWLGVSDRVELPGFLPRPELRRILARATLFVLPTRKEAMSIATLEALSAGVPVVAMGTGGVCDVLDHGVTGYLARGPGEFASHIARLLAEPDLREQMARAAPTGVHRFSWERIIARHLELYDLAAATLASSRPSDQRLPALAA